VVLLATLLLAESLAPFPSAAEEYSIVMLSSQQLAPYEDIMNGFRQHLTQQGVSPQFDTHSLNDNPDTARQLLQEIRTLSPRIMLTVGSFATQMALQHTPEIPTIACLVGDREMLVKADNATGVVLDFPIETQFEWLQRFLPEYKTIGVLFNPLENERMIQTATRTAESMGLTLITRAVETPQDLPEALNNLSRRADVLWGVSDRTVMSPQTAKALLLFSFRNRIPFIGLSAAWVKAGALYSIDRDYTDLGQQCGALAWQVLQGTPISKLPPQTPRKATYTINLKTANHMKLYVSATLISGAQQIFR
jgi:putative ABC transport system substrate-binding protein